MYTCICEWWHSIWYLLIDDDEWKGINAHSRLDDDEVLADRSLFWWFEEFGAAKEFIAEQQLKTMIVKAWWWHNLVMNSNMVILDCHIF